jgi:hypothetical protein
MHEKEKENFEWWFANNWHTCDCGGRAIELYSFPQWDTDWVTLHLACGHCGKKWTKTIKEK